MRVEYSSNNSGGRWWLTTEHWKKLEASGWEVAWGGNYFCYSKFQLQPRPENKPILCAEGQNCPGHRRFDSAEEAERGGGEFLRALAQYAYLEVPSLVDAIRHWEDVLGMDASDEGCNCCGPPHSFSVVGGGGYTSGADVIALLYPNAPKTLREAAERLR